MRIEIRHEEFKNEFYADVIFANGEIKYLSSDNIKSILDQIYELIELSGIYANYND